MAGTSSRLRSENVVIVGGGLAGLFCALKLAPRPVTVLAAAPIGEGASSAWAQGGIAAAVSEGDTVEAHLADTIAAGAGIVDAEMARQMVAEGPSRIADLLHYGVPFDRDLEGRLSLSREAAHSARRVIRVRGDMAGKAIMAALIAAVRQTPSIRVVEGQIADRLVVRDARVCGVVTRALTSDRPSLTFKADAVVLCTGGIGHLFRVTTNPLEARGDGLGMAVRAGAAIADAEFVQFHPTAIDIGRDPAPLATEALRGDGAILINRAGHRFMRDLHPDGELAPRDIVARGIFTEWVAGRGAFLDARAAIGERFPQMFPTVYETCTQAGIDPAREPIPVVPAAHYHMGGVLTDARGRTSVEGLYAAGEVASTGVHGANRLASNSLLEAVVFAARIAADLATDVPEARSRDVEMRDEASAGGGQDDALQDALRSMMSERVGVVRDAGGLTLALAEIAEMEESAVGDRAKNRLAAARVVAAAALHREESRGGHFRSDRPQSEPRFAMRSVTTSGGAQVGYQGLSEHPELVQDR